MNNQNNEIKVLCRNNNQSHRKKKKEKSQAEKPPQNTKTEKNMDSSTRVAKVLRDARAELGRPVRPNTPRGDPRMMNNQQQQQQQPGSRTSSSTNVNNNGDFQNTNNTSSRSMVLPPLANNKMNNNNNNFLPPVSPMTMSSAPSSTFAANNTMQRTATAGSSNSDDNSIGNQNNTNNNGNNNATTTTSSSSGTFAFFDVKPPPTKKGSSTLGSFSSNNNNNNNNNNGNNFTLGNNNNNNKTTTASSIAGGRLQQQQQQAKPQLNASTNNNNNNYDNEITSPSDEAQQQNIDDDNKLAMTATSRLMRKRRNSLPSSEVSDECGNNNSINNEQQQRQSLKDDDYNSTLTHNNNTNNKVDPEKYKKLIEKLDSENVKEKAASAKEILALLFSWDKETTTTAGSSSSSSSSFKAEQELLLDSEDDELNTEKLRTKALEAALALFRDNGDDSETRGWEAAKDAKLIDTALRYAESRPFGSVDFTVAVSCVKTASEMPQCIQSVFTAGGIPVLKNILEVAVEKLQKSSSSASSAIITLSVALTLQTLSALSANYSVQIIKCGVCAPCVDLAPFLENDDRASAALCSLAAKLSADDQQAVSQWRDIRHGTFASRLARCVARRWDRVQDKTAKLTGATLVARGLLAIALLIADGGTPLDQVAADNHFVTCLSTEFDEMCATMNPDTADEHEELVNALRVISGVSVNSVGGHLLADHPSLKELVSDLLMDIEPDTTTGQQVLLLALVCISNFTFYCFQPSSPSSHFDDHHHHQQQLQGESSMNPGEGCSNSSRSNDNNTPLCDSVALLWLENLLPSLLGVLFNDASSPEALVEATRALGNISRTSEGVGACRQHRVDEVVCALLNHEDPRIVYNCLGVVTNLSAIAVNEGTDRGRLPWLPICEEQVIALAERKNEMSIEYEEVAELAEAARSNISNI